MSPSTRKCDRAITRFFQHALEKFGRVEITGGNHFNNDTLDAITVIWLADDKARRPIGAIRTHRTLLAKFRVVEQVIFDEPRDVKDCPRFIQAAMADLDTDRCSDCGRKISRAFLGIPVGFTKTRPDHEVHGLN